MECSLLGWVQSATLLVTCAVMVWYTWETRKIREKSSAQARAMDAQLAILQEEQFRRVQLERNSFTPILNVGSGMHDGTRTMFDISNAGGPAINLRVRSADTGRVHVSLSPGRYFDNGQRGGIHIDHPGLDQAEDVRFSVEYESRLGETHVTDFQYSISTGLQILNDPRFTPIATRRVSQENL